MFWQNLIKLCNEHNTKPNPVAKELGIASSAVTKWKNGSIPHDTTLKKLADYFGVSVDYLLGKEQKEKPAPDNGDRLGDDIISLLGRLSPDQQRAFYLQIKAIATDKQSETSESD